MTTGECDTMAMEALDIIGDVHGCASKLRQLLDQLGYADDTPTGAYRHLQRRAVFVGDLIDRGPQQLEVLQLVKAMVDGGHADIVMGNHEFNAIAYATPDPENPNKFLRDNDDEGHYKQHAEYLKLHPAEREYYVNWFKTLPLWLDYGQVRVVHACWHEQSMREVENRCGGNRMTDEHLVEAAKKGDDEQGNGLYQAIEILLKGPEISLTDYGQQRFKDKGGKSRSEARIRWWDSNAATLRDLADVHGATTENGDPYPQLPARQIDPEEGRTYVYTDAIPLFYGHYWRIWEEREKDCGPYTACVDFSAAAGGPLVAYRWSGEPTITWENYVAHNPGWPRRGPQPYGYVSRRTLGHH